MIDVMLVDDHPVVLSGMKALVESDGDMRVVHMAKSAAEARALEGEVDVAVVDLKLPDGDGIDLAVELKRARPALRVLMLTMNSDSASVVRCLAAELDGYLLKDADPDEVLAAIRAVAMGQMVLGRGASNTVVAAAHAAPRSDALADLDARELEILECLAAGLTTGQAASRLFLSPKTIRNRTSDIVRKLGADDRAGAIAIAHAAGLGRRET